MPTLAISPVVRAILSTDINLPSAKVIELARAKGVKASADSIRGAVYNIRGELKKKGAKPTPVPAAARTTTAPKTAPAKAAPAKAASTPAPSSSSTNLSSVLANVALVNSVVGACGGTEPARQVTEAVKACGGVEAFLKHLELVAGIRDASA